MIGMGEKDKTREAFKSIYSIASSELLDRDIEHFTDECRHFSNTDI